MPQVTIVSDSVCCLPKELVRQYGIDLIPLNILYKGKTYRDTVDITPGQAYELFLKDPSSFKTSPASPESCLEILRTASQKAQNVLCVTLSRKISTLYNMVLLAREQAESELPGVSIEVLDSELATAAQGFVVLAAARTASTGGHLKQASQAAMNMKNRVGNVILLDTMRYVYRSGRIPEVAARAASVLNIRPLFTIASGAVQFVGATRNKNYGIERLISAMRSSVKQNPTHVAVMHAYALDEALNLKKRVASEFNCAELWLSEFSPIMGYACGTGTLGLAFYSD